jgi:putative flippase GtrA
MRLFWSQSCGATFLRFAVNGGGVALVAVATYCLCAVLLGWAPLLANFVAYATQLALGYQMHRLYSFRQSSTNFFSMARYLVMSVAAFALNSLWVWLLTAILGLASWTPIILMVAATPIMTFLVARYWVFRAT